MNSREKFDVNEKPRSTPFYLNVLMQAIRLGFTVPAHVKIDKVNCEDLTHPYLLISNHGSFVDFAAAKKVMGWKNCNWLVSIEEFNGREWLMRSIGSMYKRKFTKDITVVKHMLTALKKRSVVIYPEARFSLAGINEQLDGALGKLVKKANVPVAVLIMRGNFLRSPQWNKKPYRDVHVEGTLTQIVTKKEVETLTAQEIDKRINDIFKYDEYQWQLDNKIVIKSKYRAHNIHKILYQCPCCGKEFSMKSEYTRLWCDNCGSAWEMDVYGVLRNEKDSAFDRMVPEWYKWERENVKKEVESGQYHFSDTVRVEQIMSSHEGFRDIGTGTLTQDENGFTLNAKLKDGTTLELNRPVNSMYSCHIEYNFKKRGDAVELCTLKDTYFLFPQNYDNVLTKLHFATEELYHHLVK